MAIKGTVESIAAEQDITFRITLDYDNNIDSEVFTSNSFDAMADGLVNSINNGELLSEFNATNTKVAIESYNELLIELKLHAQVDINYTYYPSNSWYEPDDYEDEIIRVDGYLYDWDYSPETKSMSGDLICNYIYDEMNAWLYNNTPDVTVADVTIDHDNGIDLEDYDIEY